MSTFLAMPVVGSCLPLPAALAASQASGPIAIDKPVGAGPRASNRPEDVKVIQDALNQVTLKGGAGGAIPFLEVDGICGPKTNAAIQQFQRVQVKVFDGLVEPRQKTIIRLNEIVEPVSNEDFKAKVRAALPLVQQALAAAVANLQAAIRTEPAATAAIAADRLNRHFRFNTLSANAQGTARINLFRTYSRFLTVVSQPELFKIEATDEFGFNKSDPLIALTTAGGFFVEPEKPGEDPPENHIHLGLGFFARNVTTEFAAFIILHELSHFIGTADGDIIDDFGRGWFDDTFIRSLTAAQRMTNADNFAGFAHECRTNSALKPAFIRTAPGGLGGRR